MLDFSFYNILLSLINTQMSITDRSINSYGLLSPTRPLAIKKSYAKAVMASAALEPEPKQMLKEKIKRRYRALSDEGKQEFFKNPQAKLEELPNRKPSSPSRDMDPEERRDLSKKFNSYIGDRSYKSYNQLMKSREDAFPFQRQLCHFNSDNLDASVCYLDKTWCPFAHDKQHSEPFRTGICMYDLKKGKGCRNVKCEYLHESYFNANGEYPGIFEDGDEEFKPADQQRILLLTRRNNIVFTRCSWNHLIEILKEDAVKVFKGSEEDFTRIRFWAVKWRNNETDNWTLVVIDSSIAKAREWRLGKRNPGL